MTASKIEWTGRSDWNPIRGCTRVSPGCGGPNHEGGCYAEKIAARFSGPGQPFHGFAERTKHGGRWTGKVELIEDRLTAPLTWRKPARIFACSMSDLFHESLPDEAIDKVFAVMALAPQHTFQVLTKRAQRMRDYMTTGRANSYYTKDHVQGWMWQISGQRTEHFHGGWPLRNVWLGVSVERQQEADERIPLLLETPAAVRFLSCEPLLGAVRLGDRTRMYSPAPKGVPDRMYPVDWVIVGGESGPGARPMEIAWAHSLVMQCRDAGVACFVKQLGADPRCLDGTPYPAERRMGGWDRKGGDMDLWPEDLRIREFPR